MGTSAGWIAGLQSDFAGAEVRIEMRNQVTQTCISSDPTQTTTVGDAPMNREDGALSLIETTPELAILSLPPFSCAIGHGLELTLRVTGLGAIPFEARILGQVSEMEKDDGSRQRVTIKLKNSSLRPWAEFRSLFEKRQAAIQDYLKQARGF